MSFSLSSFVRLIVLLSVGSTMLAVGVARLGPPRPGWRTLSPATHINVNEYYIKAKGRTPIWLDRETGTISAHPLADGHAMDVATSSPWVDERGRRQVVGRWSSRTNDGPQSISNDFGLARYSFPDGEKLDQVSTEVVPVTPPCWFPGTRARVLFTAGDGMLYDFAFEPEAPLKDRNAPEARGDARPRALTWRCRKPGAGNVFIGDIAWPEDPRLGGCLLASLRLQVRADDGTTNYSRTQLWWLRLNHAGTEVVETGRLLTHDLGGEGSNDRDERLPTLAAGPDGRLLLAFLQQRAGAIGWTLCLAPVRIEGEGHAPVARESESRVLAGTCQPAHPAFSADGRWINVVVGALPWGGRVARISTAGELRADARP